MTHPKLLDFIRVSIEELRAIGVTGPMRVLVTLEGLRDLRQEVLQGHLVAEAQDFAYPDKRVGEALGLPVYLVGPFACRGKVQVQALTPGLPLDHGLYEIGP